MFVDKKDEKLSFSKSSPYNHGCTYNYNVFNNILPSNFGT